LALTSVREQMIDADGDSTAANDSAATNEEQDEATMNRVTSIAAAIFSAILTTAPAAADSFIAAVEASGVQHGVVVHLGFEDAEHAVALAREGIHLIHGISSDKEVAAAAKRRLQRENLSERASVIWQDSLQQLPYAENLINLLVVENTPKLLSQGLSIPEVLRVLVPRGIAAFEGTVDPAELSAAGFTRIRSESGWTYATKPRPAEMDDWSHLNYDASGSRVSRDRLIGPPARLRWIDGPRWQTAMGLDNTPDAVVSANGRIFYNGIAADGTGKTSIVARDAYNGMLLWARAPAAVGHPATFLAHGDKLFCNIRGGEGGLAALSAATGETILKFDDNLPAASVLYHQGVLVASIGGAMKCLDAESGALKWQFDVAVAPSRLNRSGQLFPNFVIGDEQVFYLNTPDNRRRARRGVAPLPYVLGCVDIKSGSPVWRKEIQPEQVSGTPLLRSVHAGVLILGEAFQHSGPKPPEAVHGFSTKDGSQLWRHKFEPPGHGGTHTDGFFIDGKYWIHVRDAALAEQLKWKTQATGWRALDPVSGKVVTSFNYSHGIIHRCYMDKATARYILAGSVDFVKLSEQKSVPTSLVRGGCQQGMLPANSLLYAYPHGCQCSAFLRGFVGLAADTPGKAGRPASPPDLLLEKGPAFGLATPAGDPAARGEDWPCYRHDDTRGLAASTNVPPDVTPAWQVQLGAGLTAPVAADGLVFVARSSAGEVIALDAESGEEAWRFLADGPIDTPPTIHAGLALFGCRDGSFYSLRARDGALAWRLRIDSDPHLIVADGQLESLYAIHGSAAIKSGVACFATGRHSSLDGGVSVIGVRPATGEILWRHRLYTPNREGRLADLLVGDEESLHMGLLGFDPKSGKAFVPAGSFDPKRTDHLVAGRGKEPIFERIWCARTLRQKGATQGFVLAFDKQHTYALSLNRMIHGKFGYQYVPGLPFPREGVKLFRAPAGSKPGWSKTLPGFANSLLISGESLFVGGTSDSQDSEGGVLRACAAKDGSPLSQWSIDSVPVNDGLAAAQGQLYVVSRNGSVYCFRRSKSP
jgi:outer membrane protein assembly factor BamB